MFSVLILCRETLANFAMLLKHLSRNTWVCCFIWKQMQTQLRRILQKLLCLIKFILFTSVVNQSLKHTDCNYFCIRASLSNIECKMLFRYLVYFICEGMFYVIMCEKNYFFVMKRLAKRWCTN